MKQKVRDQGCPVFKVSGNRCEIHGKDKPGKNVEIDLHPTDGHIVKQR